ncbi:ABC transporter permease [Sedimentitalea arenosa]|uniref:ABC transporter permease n=1 Tax=Sedimentitalea arenosa TaxID=2798803 RepID=A0A8J7IMG1_9RHOB|nr:ABC transporter permease [Arenibacterium arenosum]MBJ6373443.1 ABC transporter permease [Arenibacterium arenosum]
MQAGQDKGRTAPQASLRSQDQVIILSGDLVIETIETLDGEFGDATGIDISDVAHLDTAGAWYLLQLRQQVSDTSHEIAIRGASAPQRQLLETVRQNMPPEEALDERPVTLFDRLEEIGRTVVGGLHIAIEMIGFLGQVIATIASLVFHPRRLRMTSLVHHMQEVGLKAVPIVALMAFLIGIVLAFQGSAQLRQFGAEVFVVDLIAISILRELGILLTAIIVAGRSGSAFTAAIGSMKMREEVDAMRTLGLDPIEILVVPRVLALVLILPVLGFIADLTGLIGGALMSWIELGVSPAVFQSRLVANTDVWHFAVGMIKAPFFALIIGIIGCYEGLKVGGDAESLGRLTSTSVVLAIFMVIVVDAVFSVFFALVGV